MVLGEGESDLRKQVISASGGEYDYARLRKALMAIVPKVRRDEEQTSAPRTPFRQWKAKGGNPRQVNATEDDQDREDCEDEEAEQAHPEELEGELEVLLTQAARKRAEIEKARGCSRGESGQAREARIKDMKARMACSACKAHGKTVFGHWHSDPECPYNTKKNSQDGSRVLAVVNEESSDSEDDDLVLPSNVYLATSEAHEGSDDDQAPCAEVCASVHVASSGEPRRETLALRDTCCARMVAGILWIKRHVALLQQRGESVFTVDEARPFRFGGGPRISSTHAVIMPLQLEGSRRAATIRVSIVDQEIPLLLSKAVLKRMVMDLERGIVEFKNLQTKVPLRETKAGLCGFQINNEPTGKRLEHPPHELMNDEREIFIDPLDIDEQVCMVQGSACSGQTNPVQGSACSDQTNPKVRATSESVRWCEELARKLYRDRNFSFEALHQLARSLPIRHSKRHRDINDGPGRGNEAWVAGLYSHGGWAGVTKRTTRYPHVVRYLNMFMRSQCDASWTSLALLKNVSTEIHVDSHNRKDTSTTTCTFGDFRGGQLWVASPEVESDACVWKQSKDGEWMKGKLIDTYQRPTQFSPHIPHATHEWEGERWCLSVYTTRTAAQVDSDTMRALEKLKFPIRKAAASRTFGEKRHVTFMSSNHQEPQQSCDDVDVDDADEELSRTPQHGRSSHEKLECDLQHPSGAEHDDNLGAEEEGGVCHGGRESMPGDTDRAQGTLPRPLEGVVECSATPSQELGVTSELEEVGLARTSRALFPPRGRGPRKGSGPSLGSMVPQPSDHGDRDVGSGCCRSQPDGPRLGNDSSGTTLYIMPYTDDGTHQSVDQRTLLGLQTVPRLQDDPPVPVRRKGHEAGAGGAPSEGQARDDQQGEGEAFHASRATQAQANQGGSRQRSGFFGWLLGEDGADQDRQRHRVVPRRESRAQDQHQFDVRGGRAHSTNASPEESSGHQDRQGFGVPQQGADAVMACENGDASENECNQAKQPLGRDEIRRRVLEGNARRAAMIAGVFIASTALAGATQEAMPFASRIRPDIVELSSGQSYITQSFSRWGWHTLEPTDISSGLSDPRNREALSTWIENTCPRLVVLHGYCRNIQHDSSRPGVNRSQAQRRERRASERLSGVREFVHHVLERQMSRGDQFLIDLPRKGAENGDNISSIICKHPSTHTVSGHHPQGGPCVWATSCVRIADELGKLTQSQHECNGSESVDTLRRSTARAICRGYATYLRDVDPGRIRRMLRSVSARIRQQVRHGDSNIHELRWNEKNIAKVLKHWSAVFAQGDAMDEDGDEELIPDLEEPHGGQTDHHMEDQARASEAPHQHVKAKLASHGISFEVPAGRRLSEAIRHGLIKAHCKLGHPSKEDLARFLKLGGARQEVVEAVSWMRCITCAHARRPSTRRTTNIPPCQLAFGDEVQLDCVCIRDANKENHWFLSILDRATSFHVLELLRDHSPLELHRAFDRGWCK